MMYQQPPHQYVAIDDQSIVCEIMRLVCNHTLTLTEVCQKLGRTIEREKLYRILKLHPKNFEVTQADDSEYYVSGQATVGFCSEHSSKDGDCPGFPFCESLHVCKFYLLWDSCKFGDKCHIGHNLTTPHNQTLLRKNFLDHLDKSEIKCLLTRPHKSERNSTKLPELCMHYNKLSGCKFESECTKMHICRFYMIGKCRFNQDCKRNHDLFEPQVQIILEHHGIDKKCSKEEVISELRKLGLDINIDTASSEGSRYGKMKSYQSVNDEDDDQRQNICMFNLRDKCLFGNACRNYHRNLPYQWQYSTDLDSHWYDVHDDVNDSIEYNYSIVNKDKCSFEQGVDYSIDFGQMKSTSYFGKPLTMRRLATVAARETVVADPLSTEWNWYWIDQDGIWILYGSSSTAAYESVDGSDDIEKKYLEDPEGNMVFSTVGYQYQLDFKSMKQINVITKIEREVRRRPVYVTKEDLEKNKKKPKTMSGAVGSKMAASYDLHLPAAWSVDANITPIAFSSHVKRIQVSISEACIRGGTKIIDLFKDSMPEAKIISVERIENGDLWMSFWSKCDKMKRKSATADINERQLFHGTHSEYVDAICWQGFDVRLGGQTTGTKFGKGSYFAESARFSGCYTSHNDLDKVMFVGKVLVGDMAEGSSEYVRPPHKDKQKSHDLYDCCVDSVKNPNVFVIFANDQAYPEYLITYRVGK